ncbi:efflux RND transporter periplasmic adaptor subunit [Lysobacter pythonis]|uniref:Efflux RND transporter periplasmic adaptor subunit n=1 Tax=Solilutibacter pythonis TaxID=2483112 RepID=A0A3M2I2W4_9GAMM|nr:efflux RND transporter periplasmic adaptor subunit [Lysobacter pythonis]RMH92847.1 efflux RND transporter periplasmic adaptor subunit [Lysobacter pythonis]
MSIRDTSAQDTRLGSGPQRKARQKRVILVAAAAAAFVALAGWIGAGWLSGGRSVDAARVRIAQVKRGDLVRDIAAEGRVIASNSPSLYAIGGGTVTLKVVAGDAVKRGEVLAEIDSPELLSRLAQEQATLASLAGEASRAAVDARLARSNARKLLDQARVEQIAATREMQRYQRGFEGGAVAQVDFARAQDSVQKADIGLSHARQDAGLQGAAAGLDARNKMALASRQRAVVEELRRQVDALAIRAPFDGQVGQVFVTQRQNVLANAPVLSVIDLTRFEVEIKVPESFARDLGIGMPAQLTGNNQRYPATVSAVSPEVVNGEVSARLRFDEGAQPPVLRQNQRLSARILLDTRKNVLMVERGPFVEQGGGRNAWVMDGNVASKREIETGAQSLDAVEIVSGLKAGERVVVSGADGFGDAEKVRIN